MSSDTVRIKICGVSTVAIAEIAIAAGADFIGLMVHPPSKRYVLLPEAKTIARAVKKLGATPVAVFVDSDETAMFNFCEACDIEVVQLHGKLSRSRQHLLPTHYQRLYALHVNDAVNDEDLFALNLNPTRDYLLFDSSNGQGIPFALTQFHYRGQFRYFFAGGFNSENAVSTIKAQRPYGIDVSSGVEIAPGVKDPLLIQQFIQAVKSCHIP